MMMKLLPSCSLVPPSMTPAQCIRHKQSYEYTVIDQRGKSVCTIPAMTDEGCFIIQGMEKVLLIQESRLKTERFLTNNPPSCKCHVLGAYVPTIITIVTDPKHSRMTLVLDTSAIKNDLRKTESIGLWELLTIVFSNNDQAYIYGIAIHYCNDDMLSDIFTLFMTSSSHGTGGLEPEDDRRTIRKKLFAGLPDHLIIMTVVSMAIECIRVLFRMIPPSDRDSYCMKRLRTPGEIMYGMFKASVSDKKHLLDASITKSMYSCLRRGKMAIAGRTHEKMAVQLSRRSTIDAISSIRRVVVPCDENSPNIKMRQIHPSQTGFICPCETPEAKTVGIIKHLSICCLISVPVEEDTARGYLMNICNDEGHIWVFLDGAAMGLCTLATAEKIASHLKKKSRDISCVFLRNKILKIRAAAGRPIRPLLHVKRRPIDWNEDIRPWPQMISANTLQYLDPDECESIRLAKSGSYEGSWRQFTHMEIHPCTMLGIVTSLIPFPEHNQSARNVFASSMLKQAQQMHGAEKTTHTLQRPIVSTVVARAIHLDENPNGVNLVTCIMSIDGYNQEDAIIVNRACVDRGLFQSTVSKTVSVAVDLPWEIVDDRGGTVLILCGGAEKSLIEVKSMFSSEKIVVKIRERPLDTIGSVTLDVTFTEDRRLRLGDKLASRHAQKGVVGKLMNPEDMPFTRDGITPDIIINPHAIPSRMTVGQLLESVLAVECCRVGGHSVDGTPFIRKNIDDIVELTHAEYMTLGTTGERVKTPIEMGIVYYMALKHQAADKIYVRSHEGPTSLMSRQPISGRSKGGGLRFGEMEYDCLIGHGTSKLITEISENSDMTDVLYCTTCHLVTDKDPCRTCNTPTTARRMPFSYVVLKDLMLAAGIRLQTQF